MFLRYFILILVNIIIVTESGPKCPRRPQYALLLLTLHSNNLQQLQCKNKKLHKLISNKKSNKKKDSYTVPVINLSSEDLDTKPLKYGLHHVLPIKINMSKEI